MILVCRFNSGHSVILRTAGPGELRSLRTAGTHALPPRHPRLGPGKPGHGPAVPPTAFRGRPGPACSRRNAATPGGRCRGPGLAAAGRSVRGAAAGAEAPHRHRVPAAEAGAVPGSRHRHGAVPPLPARAARPAARRGALQVRPPTPHRLRELRRAHGPCPAAGPARGQAGAAPAPLGRDRAELRGSSGVEWLCSSVRALRTMWGTYYCCLQNRLFVVVPCCATRPLAMSVAQDTAVPGRWQQGLGNDQDLLQREVGRCRCVLPASPPVGVLHRPKQCGEIIFNPGLVFTGSRSGS